VVPTLLILKKLMRWLVIPIMAVATLCACSKAPMPEAQNVLAQALANNRAAYGDGFIHFTPTPQNTRGGCFIFYPGGRVSHVSYAPLMQAISDNGYNAWLLSMPLDLAMLAVDAADSVKADEAARELCSHYVLAGHSLGGVAAADYASDHPNDSLLLIAAYPADDKPITHHKGSVISVFANYDGLATVEDIKASKNTLPDTTEWLEIKGGNHAQFGWFGDMDKDGKAIITREIQQGLVLGAALELLATEQ
jgi:alpha/beta hydrolase family protein